MDLLAELGVEKLVHTSSVAAIGYRTDRGIADETTAYNWGSQLSYKYSKHLAELEVLNGVRRGLNATIVNPSVVIGPRDVYVHGGKIVRDIRRGRIPVYVDGGMNIVSIHDVVRGHLAAASIGRPGERYILGGINLSHKEIFDRTALLIGGKAPSIRAPVRFAKALAAAFDLIGDISNSEPWISTDLLAGIGMNQWYSFEKAKRELGHATTSIDDAIRGSHEWYEANGMM